MNAQKQLQTLSRRELFQRAGAGVGSLALAALLHRDGHAAPLGGAAKPAGSSNSQQGYANPLGAKPPHFPARAKNVIFLHMVGAPSHLDLFENKPVLAGYDGKPCPQKYLEGQRFAFLRGHPKLLGSRVKFN